MPKGWIKTVFRSLRDALVGEAWIKALVAILSPLDALLLVVAKGRWAYFASGAITCFLALFTVTASAIALKERRSYATYRKRARPGWDDLGRGTSKYAKDIPVRLVRAMKTAETTRKICTSHDLRILRGKSGLIARRLSSRWTAIRLEHRARRLHGQLHALERSANRFAYYERRYLVGIATARIPAAMKRDELAREGRGIAALGGVIQAGLERLAGSDQSLRRLQVTRRLNAAFGITRARLEFANTLRNKLDLLWKGMLEHVERHVIKPSASGTEGPSHEKGRLGVRSVNM